jgi:hypothetical protein
MLLICLVIVTKQNNTFFLIRVVVALTQEEFIKIGNNEFQYTKQEK